MSEHRTCNLDGCTFTAHEKIIEKHIRMQHATGLYDKIRNVSTPEDVRKWIAERKRNYPSRENIEKRYKLQEEILKRGVRISKNDNKFNKDKFRLSKNIDKSPSVPSLTKPKTKRKQRKIKEKSLIDEKADWNGNLFPFRGTGVLSDAESENDLDDEDWTEDNVSNKENSLKNVKLNNALGVLMGAYGSESEEEEPKEIKNIETSKIVEKPIINVEVVQKETKIESMNNSSDDEAPEEVKFLKNPLPEALAEKDDSNCKTKLITGTKPGRKRKRQHSKSNNLNTATCKRTKVPLNKRAYNNQKKDHDGFAYQFRKRRVTLLEKLLANEIRRERNILLQCVKFVVENNFFQEQIENNSNVALS